MVKISPDESQAHSLRELLAAWRADAKQKYDDSATAPTDIMRAEYQAIAGAVTNCADNLERILQEAKQA